MRTSNALKCIEMQSNEGERARVEAVTPYRSIHFIIHLKAIEVN